MKISVIIPLYNKERHIKRAIESVLRQTYRDFELIVVDDGSTDSGAKVVSEIDDKRLRLVRQENAGECAARNSGIKESKTEFTAFLDADDEWLPDFLCTVMSLKSRYPDASVYGTSYIVSDMNGRSTSQKFQGGIVEGNETACLLDYFAGGKKGFLSPFCSSSVMIKKDAIVAIGGFPDGLVFGGDLDTWMRLALRYPIAFSSYPMSIIYEDADNRVSTSWPVGVLPFFESLRKYLSDIGNNKKIPLHIYQYYARLHAEQLWKNLVAGDHAAVREIARDCMGIDGYRLSSVIWYAFSMLPSCFIILAWRSYRIIRGYSDEMPKFQSVYRKE